MSIRKVAFVKGEYYHIYNRGNSKQKIFYDEEDYNRFIKLLFLSNNQDNFKIHFIRGGKNVYDYKINQSLVGIGAYVLMPNHFHILITQTEDGSISKFMQKLTTGYSMYFNKKYKRTGSLFEGKFKSKHISNDKYLKYLFSYIHLNPIKLIQKDWKEKGILNIKESLDFLNSYEYSSYIDYLLPKNRIQEIILNKKYFPDYFPNKTSFQKEVLEWFSYRQDLLT